MRRDVGAIIVAGGAGVRAGGGTPKQYRLLNGTPMVVRTVRAFLAHPRLGQLVLVLPPADVAAPPAWAAPLADEAAAVGIALSLAAGGRERADSVAHGLARLDEARHIVLVHDAARPFVPYATIDAVIAAADGGEAAIAAIPVGDTLKAADTADPTRAVRTVARDGLWRAQTPQGFPAGLLRAAHARRAAEGLCATDDAALVEAAGVPVRLVLDSTRNFKVTTADDLALAELVARADDDAGRDG